MADVMFRPEPVNFGTMSAAVQELMEKEGALRFEFRVVNHKITFSHEGTEIPRGWLAASIVRAVREWKVVPEDYVPVLEGSTGTNGAYVRYDRHITFNWRHNEIHTSVPPEDGGVFLTVAAYFVGVFQKEHDEAERAKRGMA